MRLLLTITLLLVAKFGLCQNQQTDSITHKSKNGISTSGLYGQPRSKIQQIDKRKSKQSKEDNSSSFIKPIATTVDSTRIIKPRKKD